MAVWSCNGGRTCRWMTTAILTAYFLVSFYVAYVLFSKHSREALPASFVTWGMEDGEDLFLHQRNIEQLGSTEGTPEVILGNNPVVEIWGKAAIGLYLWEHIMGGVLHNELGKLVKQGHLHYEGLEFRFRTGPGVVQGLVPLNVEYLVLILNGRDESKIAFARTWLDYLPHLPVLRAAAIVMLGNENCNNDWLLPYMEFKGGRIKVAFLTYDSPLIDDVYFYQWPLGVATYRHFPRLNMGRKWAHLPRTYICNFVGTVYPNSSRDALVTLLKTIQKPLLTSECLIRTRGKWHPNETHESLQDYMATLSDSDLTLSPTGANAECYRIYEAISCGSIPVVEDVSNGYCGGYTQNVLRLLKASNAPLIYVTDWFKDLPMVLQQFRQSSLQEKARQRQKLSDWYQNFKESLKNHFVKVIKNKLIVTSVDVKK